MLAITDVTLESWHPYCIDPPHPCRSGGKEKEFPGLVYKTEGIPAENVDGLNNLAESEYRATGVMSTF